MKNTIEAIRYGIQTLNVSPDEMFSLIESSKGYEGEDYKRWLANEIIKLAEKDEVGYSQLLVKKFSIISSIIEGVDVSIKSEWIEQFKQFMEFKGLFNVVSINFDELGSKLDEEVDWYSDVDMMSEKAFSENLPSILLDALENESCDFSFVAKLGSDSCSKNSELFKSAKNVGVMCKNTGSLLLYRMCNFIEAWELGTEFKFAFFVNTGFLCDEENKDAISYFLKYFDYDGFVVNSNNLLGEAYLRNSYAFVVCTPKTRVSKQEDCFKFNEWQLNNGEKRVSNTKRIYSRSNQSMLDCIKGIFRKGQTLGYLNLYNTAGFRCTVSCSLDESSSESIPITMENLKECVIYFSVVHALNRSGLSADIDLVMSGHVEYANLFYNCVPLFLFDVDSLFGSDKNKGITNEFDVDSKLVCKLLDKGAVYFSYEAKELLGICKGFIDFVKCDTDTLTFEEIRKEANHDDLNEQYITALSNMKDYVRSLYRKIK